MVRRPCTGRGTALRALAAFLRTSPVLGLLCGCALQATDGAVWRAAPAARPLPDAGADSQVGGPGGPQSRAPSRLSLNRWHVDGFWIPALWVEPDIDDESQPGPDLDAGSGFGARVTLQGRNQGFGLLYQTTWHEETTTGSDAQAHAAYLDFLARSLVLDGSVRTYLAFDGGLGVAWFDFDGPFEDEVGAAFQLRGMLEMELARNLALQGGLAGFVWGYPGNTLGYGSYVFLGAELIF